MTELFFNPWPHVGRSPIWGKQYAKGFTLSPKLWKKSEATKPIQLDYEPIPEGFMLTYDIRGKKILTPVGGGL